MRLRTFTGADFAVSGLPYRSGDLFYIREFGRSDRFQSGISAVVGLRQLAGLAVLGRPHLLVFGIEDLARRRRVQGSNFRGLREQRFDAFRGVDRNTVFRRQRDRLSRRGDSAPRRRIVDQFIQGIEDGMTIAAADLARLEAQLLRGDPENRPAGRATGAHQGLTPARQTQSSRTSATRSGSQAA